MGLGQPSIAGDVQPERLARLMRFHSSCAGVWRPEELGEFLRHRLSAPLPAGAPDRRASNGDGFPAATGGDFSGRPSVADLLKHPDPPLDLLRNLKDFAQACREEEEPGLPPEVATVLYYASLAAGLARSGQRVAPISDSALAQGLSWSARQSWVEGQVQSLLRTSLALLRVGATDPTAADDPETLPPVGEARPGPRPPGPVGTRPPENDLLSRPQDGGPRELREPREPAADAVPEVPGYRIIGRLGEGGMGTVWRAVQLSTRREVALKLLTTTALGSHKARLRFEREVELAAKLQHPNVARVYEGGASRGLCHYAMELVEGLHLDQYAARHRLGQRQVLELMREVCRAVQHAHQRGVIHRDLKPSNILVDGEGRPRVVDFGLARAVSAEHGKSTPTLTQEGHCAGTPAFMSPEQAAGHLDRLDTRTDVYSLGASLYLLLTGHHPHDMSGPTYEAIRRVAHEDVRHPRQWGRGIGLELEALLLKALAREPERRYASAGELAEDIDNYLRGEPLAARTPTTLYVLGKRLKRHWFPLTTAASVVVAFLATGAFFYARESRHRRAAEENARQALDSRNVALSEKKNAELHLAQARIAEGDAKVIGDEIGQAVERFEQARQTLERNGASTFPAEVALWDAYRKSPPPLLELVGHAGDVNCAAYLPDGRRVISGSEDGTARMWDALTGRTIRVFAGVGRVQRLALAPGGKLVALAGVGRGLTLWEVETGKPAGEVKGFDGDTISVAFSPDGRRLLVGTTDATRNAYLFDAASGQLIREFTGHTATVRAVAFTPDGKRALTAAGRPPRSEQFHVDTTVRAWDVSDGRLIWSRQGDESGRYVADLAVSPDGAAVYACSYDGRLKSWAAADGTHLPAKFRAAGQGTGIALSPTGALLATSTTGGVTEVQWSDTGEALKGYHPRTLFAGQQAVCFAPDGRFVMAAGGSVIRLYPLFDAVAHRPPFQGIPFGSRLEELISASFSPNGRFALTSNHTEKILRVWDVATGCLVGCNFAAKAPEELTREEADEHDVLGVFLPDGWTLLAVQKDGSVVVEALDSDRPLRVLEAWGDNQAAAVAASADGKLALVRFWKSEELQLYDVASGKRLRPLRLDGGRTVDRMAFSPDGTLAAACSREGVVKVWETASGRERQSWRTTRVNRIAFNHDASLLACAGHDLQLMDTRTGAATPAGRWTTQLWSVAFPLPGERCLLVGGNDRLSSFWSPEAGTWRRLNLSGGTAFDQAVSSDGTRVFIAQAGAWGPGQFLNLSYPAELRRRRAEVERAAKRLGQAPDEGEALRELGEWYGFRGVWDFAAELLLRARGAGAEVSPLLLARCLWMSGDPERTARELEHAIAAARDVDERRYLSVLKRVAELWNGPHSWFPSPNYPVATHPYFLLSQLHVRRQEPERAVRLFEAAEAIYPKISLPLETVNLLTQDFRGPAAEESAKALLSRLLERSASDDPAYRTACYNLGARAYRLDQFEEALDAFDKSLRPGPAPEGHPMMRLSTHLWQGDTLWRLERWQEAIATWQQGLEALEAHEASTGPTPLGTKFRKALSERLGSAKGGGVPPLDATRAGTPPRARPAPAAPASRPSTRSASAAAPSSLGDPRDDVVAGHRVPAHFLRQGVAAVDELLELIGRAGEALDQLVGDHLGAALNAGTRVSYG